METLTSLHLAAYPCWVREWMAYGRGPAGRSHARSGTPPIAIYDVAHNGAAYIIAASESLRGRGLLIGESLDRARTLFSDASFHQHDPALEGAVWEDILYLLADISPRLRSLAPGWALLDPFDMPALLALNRTLRARIGVASRSLAAPRFTAMLAALEAAPGGAVTVGPRDAKRFHDRTSILHLASFGFDGEIIERLRLFGLTSIGRLMPLTRRHLVVQFGSVGAALYDLLHPKGSEPPVPLFQPPPAISAEYDFELPAVEPAELLPVLDHLLMELTERLGLLHAQLLTLRLTGGGAEGIRSARRLLKVPTARRDHLRVVAQTILAEIMRPGNPDGEPEPVETMRIELGGLVERSGMQGGLFEHRPAVYEAVKSIHRRFPGRLVRAVITDPDAYIPETGIRFEPYPTSSHVARPDAAPLLPLTPSPATVGKLESHPATPIPAVPSKVMISSPVTGKPASGSTARGSASTGRSARGRASP